MNKENRGQLFVEVHQKEIKEKIFNPIYNLYKYESWFFPKRFAILGDYRIGKTELRKFLIKKMEEKYPNCIWLSINSKRLVYMKSEDKINDWVYNQWLTHLMQASNPELKDIIPKEIEKFIKQRKYHPNDKRLSNYLDKMYLICCIYKEYLKIHPDAKLIVGFDQTNYIEKETQFTPFHEFWRNFQGYWESDNYFSELPMFIFIIGHENWLNFPQLQEKVGRGVFDERVHYQKWGKLDITQLFEKRLKFAIKPVFWDELIPYFLCPGIVDYFRKQLGEINTQAYIDTFFGSYLKDFLKDYETNRTEYKNFLDFCTKKTVKEKRDMTYYQDVEKIFLGTPALDYIEVFQFVSENQEEKWFTELFKLMKNLFESDFISFDSKDFKKYQNLGYDFVYQNFTRTVLKGINPNFTPPLFNEYEKRLMLNDTFRSCLEGLRGLDKRGPIFMLKSFIKSSRIGREKFQEKLHGKEMNSLLDQIIKLTSVIFSIVEKWTIYKFRGILSNEEEIDDQHLFPFLKIKNIPYNLKYLYKGKLTNWANFDAEARTLANDLIDKAFPEDSLIMDVFDLNHLNNIRSNIIALRTSNIKIVKYLYELLTYYLSKIEEFNKIVIELDFSLKDLIANGEDENVEFKSSLRWDYNQNKKNPFLDDMITKTISGFLNSYGGKLLIGIDDDGNVLGLENDYSILKKKDKDGFSLSLVDIISKNIGSQYNDFWKHKFIKLEDKEICVIIVKPSSKPVFTIMKNKKYNGEQFFIRKGTSTRPLYGNEMMEYIDDHFNKFSK